MLTTTRYYQVLGSEGEMTEEDEKKYDGVVIWYNERRGYGFIRFDKDEIFFASFSSNPIRAGNGLSG